MIRLTLVLALVLSAWTRDLVLWLVPTGLASASNDYGQIASFRSLEIDGGVKIDNIRQIADAGADTFVAGSAIFGKPDYKAVIDAMREELAR